MSLRSHSLICWGGKEKEGGNHKYRMHKEDEVRKTKADLPGKPCLPLGSSVPIASESAAPKDQASRFRLTEVIP